MRNQSGARVTISEQVPGASDRILSAIGSLDSVVQSFYLMMSKLATHADISDPSRIITLRMLVPHTKMGLLIGKQGSKIKELQEYSGAKLYAQSDPLPNCTERIFVMVGTPEQLNIAFRRVGVVLGEYLKDRNSDVVLYLPRPSFGYPCPPTGPFQYMMYPQMMPSYQGMNLDYQPGVGNSSMPLYGRPPITSSGQQVYTSLGQPAYTPTGQQGYTSLGQQSYSPGQPYTQSPTLNNLNPLQGQTQPHQTQQVSVPNDIVGALIGKGCFKINEMRQMSGSLLSEI